MIVRVSRNSVRVSRNPRSRNSGVSVTKFWSVCHEIPVIRVSRNSGGPCVTKFRCVRHEIPDLMGRGGASRDRRGQCSLFYEGGSRDEIPDLMGRAHFSSSDRAGLVSHTHAAVDPPSVSEAHRKLHCRVHAYHRCYSCRHHRKPKQGCSAGVRSLALQVCVLWRCVCQNAPTSPTRVSQCVRPGALACDDWLGGFAL